MNTTESPKRKISALERTIVAGMGSITMPDMMALHKKFPTLAIEDIYNIISSIEISALGTTSREFILQYAEVRLLSLRKSKTIEEATEQTREISEKVQALISRNEEKVQALISRNEELNDRLERQSSYIGKLQREISTFKSVNKNIKIVSLVLLFLLIGQVIAHFTL
jgi:predicted RNase H-like nuclease (RuvC/YqgF family)